MKIEHRFLIGRCQVQTEWKELTDIEASCALYQWDHLGADLLDIGAQLERGETVRIVLSEYRKAIEKPQGSEQSPKAK